MFARRRRRFGRALEQPGRPAAAGWQAATQRVETDAEYRSGRKIVDGHALPGDLAGAAQFDVPDDRLTGRVSDDRLAGLIERREEDLQV